MAKESLLSFLKNPVILGVTAVSTGVVIGASSVFVYNKYQENSHQNSSKNLVLDVLPTTVDNSDQETKPESQDSTTKNTPQEPTVMPSPQTTRFKDFDIKMAEGSNLSDTYIFTLRIPINVKTPIYKEIKDRASVKLDDKTILEIFLAPEAYPIHYKKIVTSLDSNLFGKLHVVLTDYYSYTNKVLATTGTCNSMGDTISAPCGYGSILLNNAKYPNIIDITCKPAQKGVEPNLALCNTVVKNLNIRKEEKIKTLGFEFPLKNNKKMHVELQADNNCSVKTTIKQGQPASNYPNEAYAIVQCNNKNVAKIAAKFTMSEALGLKLTGKSVTNPKLGKIVEAQIKYLNPSRLSQSYYYVSDSLISYNKVCKNAYNPAYDSQPPCGPAYIKTTGAQYGIKGLTVECTDINHLAVCRKIVESLSAEIK